MVGFAVENRGGWSLLVRATLVVFDGPEDEGFLLRRLDGSGLDRAPSDWDDAVEHHGGAWLLVDDGEGIFARVVA